MEFQLKELNLYVSAYGVRTISRKKNVRFLFAAAAKDSDWCDEDKSRKFAKGKNNAMVFLDICYKIQELKNY